MKATAACGVAMGVLVASAAAQAPPPLTRLLEAELARFPARAGIYVKHLTTGDEAAVRADDSFNSASVIKIPVMVLAFRLADQRALDLDRRVELRPADIRGGSGILRYHDVGLAPTVRDLITQMIITSDNTATDLMIERLGGVAKVNQWLAESGYARTTLHQTVFEVFRKRFELLDPELKSLAPEDLYAIQTSNPSSARARARVESALEMLRKRPMADEWNARANTDRDYWLGAMTPRETGRLLEGIERETIASPASCQAMKRILRQQQSGARRLPHFVEIPVGHKTGDIPPVVANDVGMLYARSGPIVVAAFTNAIQGSYAETEDRIGQVARLIVEYFDGKAER